MRQLNKAVVWFVLALASASMAHAQAPAWWPPTPPAAKSLGYTNLAFLADFTAPVYTNMSNWLDCAGAEEPQWWISGFIGDAPPCSRVAMVSDGNLPQVLSMRFTAADAASGALQLTNVNQRTGYNQGTDFPNGTYYQITMRVTRDSIDANWYGTLAAAFWTWSDSAVLGASAAFGEWDFMELWANGGNPPVGHDYDNTVLQFWNPHGQALVLDGWGSYYPIDQSQWFKLGILGWQNGRDNISMCSYINDVIQHCEDMISQGISVDSSVFDARNYLILLVGPLISVPILNDMEFLIKEIEVWSCPDWWSPVGVPKHTCNGP